MNDKLLFFHFAENVGNKVAQTLKQPETPNLSFRVKFGQIFLIGIAGIMEIKGLVLKRHSCVITHITQIHEKCITKFLFLSSFGEAKNSLRQFLNFRAF